MCIKGLAMKEDAISGPTLEGGTSCYGDGFAGGVACPHHDLQPK
jgi:hypothetical protein